jgi:hypothetical protein
MHHAAARDVPGVRARLRETVQDFVNQVMRWHGMIAMKKPEVEERKNHSMRSIPLKEDFSGDGPVVSYLINEGDNHETYDNSISLCVRALQHGRTCTDGS